MFFLGFLSVFINLLSFQDVEATSYSSWSRTERRLYIAEKIRARFERKIFAETPPQISEDRAKPLQKNLLLKTPEKVKGIYMTGFSFSSEKKRTDLIDLLKKTELNSLVIDVRDSAGKALWKFSAENLEHIPLSSVALTTEEMKSVLSELQREGIYTIARVVTFQDSLTAEAKTELSLRHKNGNIWRNRNGVAWLDMTKPAAWEIPIDISREAIAVGFDEIQFDYIRFPTDGWISRIAYENLPPEKPKHEALTEFFASIKTSLAVHKIPLSIDLFGFTYSRSHRENDLNIGQRVIDAAQYFDYLSPMVYPSHYPTGYLGLKNPAAHPYAIVANAMKDGGEILESVSVSRGKSRPWLQDFDMGANYNAWMIRQQIQAVDEAGGSGWILWNAANRYTTEAFNPSEELAGKSE